VRARVRRRHLVSLTITGIEAASSSLLVGPRRGGREEAKCQMWNRARRAIQTRKRRKRGWRGGNSRARVSRVDGEPRCFWKPRGRSPETSAIRRRSHVADRGRAPGGRVARLILTSHGSPASASLKKRALVCCCCRCCCCRRCCCDGGNGDDDWAAVTGRGGGCCRCRDVAGARGERLIREGAGAGEGEGGGDGGGELGDAPCGTFRGAGGVDASLVVRGRRSLLGVELPRRAPALGPRYI
jgi:hypothetical protein